MVYSYYVKLNNLKYCPLIVGGKHSFPLAYVSASALKLLRIAILSCSFNNSFTGR